MITLSRYASPVATAVRFLLSCCFFICALALLAPSALRADVHAGTWSAKATLGGASYTQIYGVANVAQNTNYVASLWIKGSGSLTFIVNNPAWTYFPASMTVTATNTWTKVTLPAFNSGTNTQLVLRLYDEIGSSAGSVLYIDDGFLGVSGGSNLLGNPGFESGASGWVVGSAFAVGQFGGGGAPIANGTYTLAPANATGLRADVVGAGTTDGTNVDAFTSNGGTNQQWIFTNVSGNIYRISPVHAPSECLDVSGQATASGTNVQIWTYLSQQNQQWAVTAVSGGYTLTPQHATGLRLNNTGTTSTSNVNVTTANGATAQTWIIAAAGGGGVPAAPTGLTAMPNGSGQVSLVWNASAGASSYSVFRGTTANGESTTAIATGVTTTNYPNSGLTNGTTYYYKVKAVNASGSSGYSNEASATPSAGSTQTIGGGTISSPASGPAPSFGIGGSGFVLVKNWDFGTGGTIKNRNDLNQEFQYTDQFNQPAGGGNKYGSLFIGSDSTHKSVSGRYDGGPGTPNTRDFMADTLRTYLVPLDGTSSVFPGSQNVGCGSIVAKWTLPAGGSHLNQDILWEVRVKFTPLQEFWFAVWTSGNMWDGGAEEDVVESFGWDHGGGNTNWAGRLWHSDSVGGNNTQNPNFINDWPAGMSAAGVNPNTYDPMQFHVWTWLFKRDNTFAAYVDNVKVQSGTLIWTDGGTSGGTPINMFFELDGAWGHWGIGGDMNISIPATTLTGKYYDWDYSRVYLKP